MIWVNSISTIGDDWAAEMIPPFTHKFVLFDEIKDCLTGFVRIIDFRCLKLDDEGNVDPTLNGAKIYNGLLSITEGGFL